MRQAWIQLFTGALGSVGFAILFHLRASFLYLAAIGGFCSWGIYLLGIHYGAGVFLSCFLAAAFAALYSEGLARYQKAPAILFFIPTIIPLVPGSNLYYALDGLARFDQATAQENLILLGEYAMGIALGISVVWALLAIFRSIRTHGRESY
jgi:uncharacterized membrane protein YjjB (DUF3815 family)